MLALLYGVNLVYCGASFGLGPLGRTIQSVPALMRCTMQITVGQYLFRFLLAKWAGAFVMGLWVMLAALAARRAAAGWAAALAVPLAMYGIRAAIPATARLNVVKYANLASLLQTNELLGNYRNLYWFGHPIGLPLVEWTAAVLYGAAFLAAFCLAFAKAQLLPAAKRSFVLRRAHKTRPTTVRREEARKLLVTGGAAAFLAAFLAFGIYQGVTSESYIGAEEIYYAHYMKGVSGPFTQESYDWLEEQGGEFAPMLEAQRLVAEGALSSDAMLAYMGLQQKYSVYQEVIGQNINTYLKEHPGAWLVYESGYRQLFGFSGTADLQDTLYAGLLCAVCFAGLFAMERRGGMDEILRATPLGRRHTVRAKLLAAGLAAAAIAAGTTLPHLIQVLRDYGLPALSAPRHEHPGVRDAAGGRPPVRRAGVLAFVPHGGLPVHGRGDAVAGAGVRQLSAGAVRQRGGLLPAAAAGAFGHGKRHPVAGDLAAVPRRGAADGTGLRRAGGHALHPGLGGGAAFAAGFGGRLGAGPKPACPVRVRGHRPGGGRIARAGRRAA